MIEQRGNYAGHFRAADPGGFAGWHAIVGGVTGWSAGSRSKQEWFLQATPWSELAPVITPALDRPYVNGIRMLVGQGGPRRTVEPPASAAGQAPRRVAPKREATAATAASRAARVSSEVSVRSGARKISL
jgi:hypothetical protein